ncbi:hypothetical protein BLNAU_11071 [Blattamonas nauphoetae]|uniref:Uncharacterized protein n=1 Tax=Blattamonas nauphoetae TaxID=2049346 RepID=A0ABQ9XQV4_9EUKA|nr:hypothetical protein BLNAU_11071 [Blattamonas nauphoetae]
MTKMAAMSCDDNVLVIGCVGRLVGCVGVEGFGRLFLDNGLVQMTLTLLLSPVPAVVSVVLELLTRLVRASSDAVRMELVRRGVLDAVVVSVSSSSFLEDFENGIVLVGTLLGTLRRSDQNSPSFCF